MATASLAVRADAQNVINFRFYYYQPAMSAAIIFIILFSITTLLHFYQMLRTRTWFMIPFVVGGTFETVGYIGRALSAAQNPGPYTLGPYVIQAVLLLVAPALFAASIYMELGRIAIMVHGDAALLIRRTWLTKIFVAGDVFSFLLQSSGAGLLATGNIGTINTGNNIIIVGLFLQVAFFGLFVAAAALFHLRMMRQPTSLSLERPWKKHMLSMYIVSVLILIRSVVRCVEYIQGYHGFIMSHEAFLYVFDGMVMFFAVVTMNWIHPGEVARHVRNQREESERAKGANMRMGDIAA